MTGRILLDADKLLISKSGEEVTSPSLADEDKVFDSRWLFTSYLIDSGLVVQPTIRQATPTIVLFNDTISRPSVHIEFFTPARVPSFTGNTGRPMLGTTQTISGYPDQSGDGTNYFGIDGFTFANYNHVENYDSSFVEAIGSVKMNSDSFEINWNVDGYYTFAEASNNGGAFISTDLSFSWFLYALPL